MENINEQVKEFLAENFIIDDIDELDEEMSLLENGIIDSTGVLELIQYLEESFEIKVQDDEILPDNLDSLNKIKDYVERKMAA